MQQLEFEAAKIKAEKEELVLETALAESKAKLRVLKEYERSEDGLSSYSSVQSHKVDTWGKERAFCFHSKLIRTVMFNHKYSTPEYINLNRSSIMCLMFNLTEVMT